MAPRRSVSTVAKKEKRKATRGTSKRARAETIDFFHYLSEKHEERFEKLTSHWSIWRKWRLQLEDFPHSELFNLIDVCIWSQIAETLHKIYSQLVHEFYANFNQEIDTHGMDHYGHTWVQGKWFMFTPLIIKHCYKITSDDVPPLPTIHDMGEVDQFLYDRDDAWLLLGKDFGHSKLTDSLLILNLFVSHNIDLTTHRTTINDAKAQFLYHLAYERKLDLESYIYTLISNLGF
ncbi:Uncharacterized protein Adt_35421 [Abeliophyllum distichum]|uniref:Putative plant transposon protein domain-containing protein n=1 Tax=Abeliophyllum distichum TaxID=126358 RepID=A0ABD1QEN9_9LAMI